MEAEWGVDTSKELGGNENLKQIPEVVQVYNNACRCAMMIHGGICWPHRASALPGHSNQGALAIDEAWSMGGCKSTLFVSLYEQHANA